MYFDDTLKRIAKETAEECGVTEHQVVIAVTYYFSKLREAVITGKYAGVVVYTLGRIGLKGRYKHD